MNGPMNEEKPEDTRGEAAWQEMVWRQAFNAALPAVLVLVGNETGHADDESSFPADVCKATGAMADAALAEWKQRWQR